MPVGAPKAHGPAVRALNLVHEVHHDSNQDDGWQQRGNDQLHDGAVRRVDGEAHLGILAHQLLQAVGTHVVALKAPRLVLLALELGILPVLAGQLAVRGLVGNLGDAPFLDRNHILVGREGVHLGISRKALPKAVNHVRNQRKRYQRVDDAAPTTSRATTNSDMCFTE